MHLLPGSVQLGNADKLQLRKGQLCTSDPASAADTNGRLQQATDGVRAHSKLCGWRLIML